MNLLIILSELLSVAGLTFLFIFLLLSGLTRRELTKMYIDCAKPSKYFTIKMTKIWKYLNIVLLIIACGIFGSKFTLKYKEVSQRDNKVEAQQEVVIEEPKIKMNEQVFYYCLNSAKNKEGLKAAEINACKEAAIIDLVPIEDKDKYTLSKRDMVFY